MDIINLIFIAVGLAMDAFAVSIADGIVLKCNHVKRAVFLGFIFGAFQAVMPLIGWLLGTGLRGFISSFDHWTAFVILVFIGSKMIYEGTKLAEKEKGSSCDSLKMTLILGVATSIDALSVGLSFAVLGTGIIFPAVVIGIITFIFCFFGVIIGSKVGHFFEGKIEIAGGLCLIAIGTKILIEHLF